MNASALQAVFTFLTTAAPEVIAAISAAKASGLNLSALLPSDLATFESELETGYTLFQSLAPLFTALKAVPPKSAT